MSPQDILVKNFLAEEKDSKLDWSEMGLPKPLNMTGNTWMEEPYMFVSESKINEIIDEKVNQKINEILEQKTSINFRKVSKSEAKEDIINFIRQRHEKGIFQVSILDIVLNLKLPAEQVEKIMDEFEKLKKIKEI